MQGGKLQMFWKQELNYSWGEVSAGRDGIGIVGMEDSRGAGSTALCQ